MIIIIHSLVSTSCGRDGHDPADPVTSRTVINRYFVLCHLLHCATFAGSDLLAALLGDTDTAGVHVKDSFSQRAVVLRVPLDCRQFLHPLYPDISNCLHLHALLRCTDDRSSIEPSWLTGR